LDIYEPHPPEPRPGHENEPPVRPNARIDDKRKKKDEKASVFPLNANGLLTSSDPREQLVLIPGRPTDFQPLGTFALAFRSIFFFLFLLSSFLFVGPASERARLERAVEAGRSNRGGSRVFR